MRRTSSKKTSLGFFEGPELAANTGFIQERLAPFLYHCEVAG